ncbi:response regulator [Flavobacterium sp.]|uniref:response regulator n=1 Tax=Flavobacterium sp. TaxID=239 RepID=UPI0037532F7E
MKKNLNILIVDDYLIVRKGIELIIHENIPNTIVHHAENYNEAIQIIKALNIDLIILDIIIEGVEDIKIMFEIKHIQKKTKILIFSCHEEEFYGLRYIKNGADGFLNKTCTDVKIIEVIYEILAIGNYHSKEIKDKLISKGVKKRFLNPIENLSDREFEVAKMLVNGSGNLEIANKLNIQMSTVSTYKTRVFEKLDINNIVALSAFFKPSIN